MKPTRTGAAFDVEFTQSLSLEQIVAAWRAPKSSF